MDKSNSSINSQVNCFVIGPGKAGTTLMISLLDNHPEFSTIPLEVKFYEHYYKSLKATNSYYEVNRFFFLQTKISLLDSKNKNKADLMNSGYIDFAGIDFEKFKTLMDENASNFHKNKSSKFLFSKYIIDLHKAYDESSRSSIRKGFAIKEGNFGLPYIDLIKRDFSNAKFLVITRDPRDIFSSYKSIGKLISNEHNFASFGNDNTIMNYLFSNRGKSQLSFMEFFENKDNLVDFHFVRYEDLVNKTALEMSKVAEFLGVNFSDNMIEPTNAGNKWYGNSSSNERLDKVMSSRLRKWDSVLEKEEIKLLEYFLSPYFENFNYEKKFPKLSFLDALFSLKISHFGKPKVIWKDFIRPYFRILKYLINSSSYFVLFLKQITKAISIKKI